MIFSTLPKKEIPEELVEQVQTNTSNISTIQDDVSEVEAKNTEQDTAISANTTAINGVKDTADANAAKIAQIEPKLADAPFLPISGGTMKGSIDAGNKNIRNLYEATFKISNAGRKYLRFHYREDQDCIVLDTQNVHPPTNERVKILGVDNPTNEDDAANKKYVDSHGLPEHFNIIDSQSLSGVLKPPFGGCAIGGNGISNIITGAPVTLSGSSPSYVLYVNCFIQNNTSDSPSYCTFIGCVINGAGQFRPKCCKFIGYIFDENMQLAIETESIFLNCILQDKTTFLASATVTLGGCYLPFDSKPSNWTILKGWGNNKSWANIS